MQRVRLKFKGEMKVKNNQRWGRESRIIQLGSKMLARAEWATYTNWCTFYMFAVKLEKKLFFPCHNVWQILCRISSELPL